MFTVLVVLYTGPSTGSSDVEKKKYLSSLWPFSAIKGTTIAPSACLSANVSGLLRSTFIYFILHNDDTALYNIRRGFNCIVYHLRRLVREIIKKKEQKISYMENITAASSDDDRSVISLSARISIFPAKTLTGGLLHCSSSKCGFFKSNQFLRSLPHFFHFFFTPETRRVWHLLVIDEFCTAGNLENGNRKSHSSCFHNNLIFILHILWCNPAF